MRLTTIRTLVALKVIIFASLAGTLFFQSEAKPGDEPQAKQAAKVNEGAESVKVAESPSTKTPAEDTSEFSLAEIPPTIQSPMQAQRIRRQLEILRNDVETRIEALKAAQASYAATRKSIAAELQRIEEEKRYLHETLQKEKEVKQSRLDEAIGFVAKMEPRKAAPMLEGMDKDLVIRLFKELPPRLVTRILEAMKSQKATEFMEYYSRIRSGREYEILRELGLCQSGPADEGKPLEKKDADAPAEGEENSSN